MPDPFDTTPMSTLGRDFGIFLEPGFLVTLATVFVLAGLGIAVLIYANAAYGIPPF